MTLKSLILGGACALTFATPMLADIVIEDAYARSSGAAAKTGAAFFTISNTGTSQDRLMSAATTASKIAELHTHIEADNGVMLMREVEGGFEVEAGGEHALMRGGDHVMLMGLNAPFVQGESIELTLTFEHAGEITVMLPIDNERQPEMAHGDMHGDMHGDKSHDDKGDEAHDHSGSHAHH